MSFYNHLDRDSAGRLRERRNAALEALCSKTGEEYSTILQRMQHNCSDAPGITRHQYEAEWAQRQLEKAGR